MDTIKFATLVAYVVAQGREWDQYSIRTLYDMLETSMQSTVVTEMLDAMANGDRVTAIKACRKINPQFGLKEAKDYIEAAMHYHLIPTTQD